MTSEEAKQIKLSKRIQMYEEYDNHPLQGQYLKEKEELKKDLADRYQKEVKNRKKGDWLKIIPFVMIVFFFGLFWYGIDAFGSDVGVVVVLGILNLIVCGLIIAYEPFGKKNPVIDETPYLKEYNEFTEKYKALGLIEVTTDDLLAGSCYEYDSQKQQYICCVTGCSLTDTQYCHCREIHDEHSDKYKGSSVYKCSQFYEAVYGSYALEDAMRRGEFKEPLNKSQHAL